MIALLYGVTYIFIALLSWACFKGAVHLVRACTSGKTQNVKLLLLAELRVGLFLAGMIIIVVTHGHGIRVAQVLLIIMCAIGILENLRVFRGYKGHS